VDEDKQEGAIVIVSVRLCVTRMLVAVFACSSPSGTLFSESGCPRPTMSHIYRTGFGPPPTRDAPPAPAASRGGGRGDTETVPCDASGAGIDPTLRVG